MAEKMRAMKVKRCSWRVPAAMCRWKRQMKSRAKLRSRDKRVGGKGNKCAQQTYRRREMVLEFESLVETYNMVGELVQTL